MPVHMSLLGVFYMWNAPTMGTTTSMQLYEIQVILCAIECIDMLWNIIPVSMYNITYLGFDFVDMG